MGEAAHPEAKIIDWGSALIMPGLVNAHAHLELTRLHGKIPYRSSMTDWLSSLVEQRQTWEADDYRNSTQQGVQRCLAGGTTLVGDISTSGGTGEILKSSKLRGLVFEETLAMDPGKTELALASLEARLAGTMPDDLVEYGISPHAPYSVSDRLYRASAKLALERNMLLATHVAESEAELVFLRSGTGEFREFLDRRGALPARWKPPGVPPISYLDSLSILSQPSVLVHCNYLDPESMATISGRPVSVVYCPRSHAFFGHRPHPVRRLLDLGINVALGTDSLASNNSLSVLDEMRFLHKNRKDIKCDEILRMATLNGAAALRFGGVLGRLRRGFWADMTVLGLPKDPRERNLLDQILEGAGDVIGTIVRGRILWKKPWVA